MTDLNQLLIRLFWLYLGALGAGAVAVTLLFGWLWGHKA